jgi:uncharacterized protein YjiK
MIPEIGRNLFLKQLPDKDFYFPNINCSHVCKGYRMDCEPFFPYISLVRIAVLIKISKFYLSCLKLRRSSLMLPALCLFLTFCDSSTVSQSSDYSGFPYRLNSPDSDIKLPAILEEISGLSWCSDGSFACVQDEKAIIFKVKPGKKLKISEHKFGKDGDFEDLAIVGKTAYVLRNDGRIYRVKDFKKDDPKVKKYKTGLSKKNDTEGMEYDASSNSLLIACKSSPNLEGGEDHKGFRVVYRFDLDTKSLDKEPFLRIDLKNLNNYRDRSSFTRMSEKLARSLGLVESETSFKPSGISVHPGTGNFYLISSVGKLLVVIDRNGKVIDIHDLDERLFRQPEGICFSPSGEMYISNEGQGGKGYILKFKPQNHD